MLKCTPFFFVCFLTVTKKKFFIEFFQTYICSNQISFLFGFCEDIKTTLVVAFSSLFPFKSRFCLTSSISKMKMVLLEHFWVETYHYRTQKLANFSHFVCFLFFWFSLDLFLLLTMQRICLTLFDKRFYWTSDLLISLQLFKMEINQAL